MADYKKMFADALMAQQSQQDPIQKQYEAELMRGNDQASVAPTMALIDQFTGSNLSAAVPKQESMKDKLGQLLQLRQGQQNQRLNGMGKLAQMQSTDEQNSYERAFKERMFGLQLMKARDKANKAPKLGSEDKKALGYTQSLKRDLALYKDAIKSGGLRPGLWTDALGDTPTTAIRKRLVENYGRLQSGGAISGDEEKRFGALFGNMMDNDDVIAQKLIDIEKEIESKNALYGGGAMPNAGRIPSNNSGFDYDSLDDAELEARYLSRMRGN